MYQSTPPSADQRDGGWRSTDYRSSSVTSGTPVTDLYPPEAPSGSSSAGIYANTAASGRYSNTNVHPASSGQYSANVHTASSGHYSSRSGYSNGVSSSASSAVYPSSNSSVYQSVGVRESPSPGGLPQPVFTSSTASYPGLPSTTTSQAVFLERPRTLYYLSSLSRCLRC